MRTVRGTPVMLPVGAYRVLSMIPSGPPVSM
jgi:hypothetical protein